MEETLAMRAASVNGLTRNAENWLESIPGFAKRFASSVFSDEAARELPPSRPGLDCAITVKEGEKLSSCKLYDMSKEQLSTLRNILDEQLEKGFIQPSSAGNASPVFFVTDNASASRGVDQLRLVVDYRDLNSKMLLDEYPLPLVRTVMERLPRAAIFTKFDVRAGFNNIRIRPGDESKTAFKTFFGLFEYKVMPFGLATAPSVFQRFINHVLAPFLDIFVFAYLDDIIIFSENERDHEKHVTQVLEALEKAHLHLKPAKCVWNAKEVSFLGFSAVAGKGIRMSDDKLEAMRNWDRPKSVREVRSFLGLTNFYHGFIPHYSDICSPLTALTGKNVPFEWTSECQRAFDRLKTLLRNDVFLAAFDWDQPVFLETDASNTAYAGVITQDGPDGKRRPIVMFSHKFKDHEKNWPVHDKELYAIVYAFDRYRHFLQGKHCVEVTTDHRNLAKFLTTTKLTGRLARWWEQLANYNFLIQYRPGEENTVADALSRYVDETPHGSYDCLLPRHRFSAKALADIDTIKGAGAVVRPSILGFSKDRYVLEAKRRKKFGSADPVSHAHAVWDISSARMGHKAGIGFVFGGLLGGNSGVTKDKRGNVGENVLGARGNVGENMLGAQGFVGRKGLGEGTGV
jgi:hypothetical protein